MTRMRNPALAPPIRQADAYWTALFEESGSVPLRSRVDPRGLQGVLDHAFILERSDAEGTVFRLSGQMVCQTADEDLRGRSFLSLFPDTAHPRIAAVLEHMFEAPAVAQLALRCASAPIATASMLLMPLRSDDGAINRALGVMVANPIPVDPPYLFELENADLRSVRERSRKMADVAIQPPRPQRAAAFAETQAPLTGASHLRLVASKSK
ncbi:MAG: PAS domain-containing protein [Rhodobacteraceae bacterium]|nr:PAS domain-containing protein [Paracoccaceae bacterium]